METRKLAGFERTLARSALVAIVVIGIADILNLPLYFGAAYHRTQVLSLIFGSAAVYVFMAYPPLARLRHQSRVPLYDWLLVLIAISANIYVAAMFGEISSTLGQITPFRVVLGAVGVALCLEMVRRCVGLTLIAVVAVFILYARFSDLVPDAIYARPSSWERIASYLFLDPAGLYGVALDTITGVVLAFILFGNLLFATGGGQFVTDVSLRVVGRFAGGPAKMSVISSSLFGSMTGSAAANVVFTGMVTIPLMKKVGYRPAFAGAVEAVASSGGLLMPPVMGAAAFLMSEFINIPYGEIALSAAIPALLYYACVFMQVHLVAKREGLRGLKATELPTFEGLWRGAILFLVPLTILIYALFVFYLPAQTSVLYAIGGLVLLIAAIRPDRLKPASLLNLIEKTGGELVQMIAISALAGLILGVVTLKGLGSTLSQALILVSGQNVFALLALTAVACIVLGMGLPATAIYILLAILVGPALIKFGIDPLAAHMFIFYFGIMSYVTPPMAFACFVSGPMAGADPFRTAVEAMKLCIVAYIVPFLFVLHPELLLRGGAADAFDTAVAVFTALAGAIYIAGAVTGYLIREIGWIARSVLAVGAALLFVPGLHTDIIGAVILAAATMWLFAGRIKPAKSP